MAETKEVFVIDKNGDKSFWHRCGIAFVNRRQPQSEAGSVPERADPDMP
jgi:hypothetical protein